MLHARRTESATFPRRRCGCVSYAVRDSARITDAHHDTSGPAGYRVKPLIARGAWVLVCALAAFALGAVALERGEPVNSSWIVTAAVCVYAIGYRFYAKFIA